MTSDYSMTWMYQNSRGDLFPKTTNDLQAELEEVYVIENREYEIIHITENENIVTLEIIESYFDPQLNEHYTTPMVIVLELENGKIKTGRHYCDPKISYLQLKKEVILNAIINNAEHIIINKDFDINKLK